MSIMDTIKGAQQEASANVSLERPRIRSKKKADAESEQPSTGGSQGFTRKSASKAKPRREQAAGVRVVASNGKSKSKKPQTKEEAKAERKHDREVSDLRYNVTQKLLEERDDYNKARKLWWKFLIASVVLMVLAIALYLLVTNNQGNVPDWVGLVGITLMVVAYGVVIAGIVYDWRVIRPMRKDMDSYVQSMSEKRLVTAINKGVDKDKNKGRTRSASKSSKRKRR